LPFLGEAAALGTALCWTFGSLLFTLPSRKCGALAVNLTRITLAFLVLAVLVFLTGSEGLGTLTRHRVLILALSGWVGLTLGDWALFTAYAQIGPRISTLVTALAPPMAAAMAIPVLSERIGIMGYLGMSITLFGVVWVVLERSATPMPRGHRIRGLFLAFLGAAGQAGGLVLSKLGMEGEVPPLTATMVRMAAATVGIWLVAGAGRRIPEVMCLLRDRASGLAVIGATLIGPVTGVTLSLVAVSHTQAGIAATLMAPVPVFILPLVRVVYGEQVSLRAGLGAIIAVGGVAVLFLR